MILDLGLSTPKHKVMKSLGITLIVIGAIALLYTGFKFTTKEKVVDLGPLEVNKEKEHHVNWPPIAGGVLLVGGIVLLVTANKK